MAQEPSNANAPAEELDLNEILRIRREKLSDLQRSGRDPYQITKFERDSSSMQIKDHFDEMEGKSVRIAGRMMSKRDMGKASFCDVQDRDGRIQVYAKIDDIGEDSYTEFKKFDIGDIVGVAGIVFRPRR